VSETAEASRGWLEELSKDLGLSDDQKNRVREVLGKANPELEEERSTATAALDAFKKDDFSMEKVSPIAEVGERTRARVMGMITRAKELAAILTPAQRAELANMIGGAAQEKKQIESGKPTGAIEQTIAVRRTTVRAGSVGGWGRGGYAARRTTVRTGYAAGYPLGGYGPGIW
jgi:hypothetical protein